jgi:hypothetical protein
VNWNPPASFSIFAEGSTSSSSAGSSRTIVSTPVSAPVEAAGCSGGFEVQPANNKMTVLLMILKSLGRDNMIGDHNII